jgi:hypothetical protein
MDLPCAPRCAAALVASSVLCATPQAEAGIGRTPGFASVSPDGQALYTIPLTLPPGTNGMTPVLSLDYSHRNRGGLLGVGWSIGGLSQITRCAKNHAQDGVADPPALNIFDRYCLDGQRLVAVAGGLGTAAAEYRSEIESFARIRAFAGSSAFGPA